MQQDKDTAEPAARQRILQVPSRHSKSNPRYCLQKIGRQKYRNVTRSLHSIQVNRHSLHIHVKPKLLSDRDLHKPLEVQLRDLAFIERIMQLKSRSLAEKLETIEGEGLQEKEQKLKGCIEAMQGVLENIQNQKSSRKMFKSIRYPTHEHSNLKRSPLFERGNRERAARANKQGRESTRENRDNLQQRAALEEPENKVENEKKAERENKEMKQDKPKFEIYIKNECKSRESSKILLIRKAKTKSTLITQQELKYSVAVNPKRLQTLSSWQPKADQQPSHSKRIPKIEIIVQNREEVEPELGQTGVSAIARVNQSSFMSDCGKKQLIGELKAEKCHLLCEIEESKGKKKSIGFAEKPGLENNRRPCKVKNNKKLQSVFPSGFF